MVAPGEAPPPVCVPDARPGGEFTAELDYLLWFFKRDRVNEPLAVTSSSDVVGGQAFVPVTLFGNQSLGNNGPRNGLRLRVAGNTADGWWAEGSGLLLERDVSVYNNDPASLLSPRPLARPFINASTGAGDRAILNLGTAEAGSIAIRSTTKMWGAEANVGARTSSALVDTVFVGYRFLGVRDSLNITDRNTVQTGGVGFFNGVPLNEGDTTVRADGFSTRNDFHGAQIGAKSIVRWGSFDAAARASVAVGFTNETLTVAGSTTLIRGENNSTTLPGGLLALPSNMGSRTRASFAVVPEGDLSVGCQVFDHLRVSVGYNFVYCSSVVRPGDQVSNTISVSQVPTNTMFNAAVAAPFPRPTFNQSDFWAHGLSFEMLYSF
jgi:hypothetical protein